MKKNKIALKVSIITIVGNVFLAVIKLLAGIISNSSAMISDAVHTISDIGTTIIAVIGVKIGNRKEDKGHMYGHERLECIASLLLSMILFITSIELGINGISTIVRKEYVYMKVPGIFSIVVAVISIITKEVMFHYTIRVAKKINSDALKADAWHHRSDSFSSFGALIGIILSRMGYSFCDPLAGIIISIIIGKVAVEIFLDSTDKLVDKSCSEEKVNAIKDVVLKQKGVLGIDDLKTRIFGTKIYVDIEISADGNKTLKQTHKIAEKVHNKVEKEFKDIKHIMVHVNPYKERK